jgi:hypothetical protein
LFPLSSIFWWYFEYLNRFVQNWYYVGVEDFSPLKYVVYASICFSTVLPAVLSTYALLRTFPLLVGAFTGWHPVRLCCQRGSGVFLVASAVVFLSLTAVYPNYLFPLIWTSPLLVITGIQIIFKQPHIFTGVRQGNWQRVVLSSLAALICGFFWEMWNWKSLAHWEYSVPFVHRFQVFEMPLIGYAGYLPFGLECIAAASLVNGNLKLD